VAACSTGPCNKLALHRQGRRREQELGRALLGAHMVWCGADETTVTPPRATAAGRHGRRVGRAGRSRCGLGHMTLVISGKHCSPLWLRPKRVLPKFERTCGLTTLRDLIKASQSLKIDLDRGYLKGYTSNELGASSLMSVSLRRTQGRIDECSEDRRQTAPIGAAMT
jgi:hypothetical protein